MVFRIYDHDDMVIIPYKNKVLRIFISLKGGRGGGQKRVSWATVKNIDLYTCIVS